MKRVVVERFGGPQVLRVMDEDDVRPRAGEVAVKVLAAGVSFTDQLIRAGTYLGGPKPPFTPGYELVGIVEELGPGCSALRCGDRVASLTVWGAYAERVCIAEMNAIKVPEDLDPAEIVSLVFPYMTGYQLLHRTAQAKRGEAHRALVERLGGVAIDYRHEDFVARVRELTGDGVDVALDGIGGRVSLRSFRALRPGGRLVVFGHHSTLARGRKSRRGWIAWYASMACLGAWGLLSRRRRVLTYRIAKLRDRHPDWFREDLLSLLQLLREGRIRPTVVERLPLTDARRAHELLERSAAAGRLVLIP